MQNGLGWVLKKFQVGRFRYKFQVGVGGKTWKCVLKSSRVETATKPVEIRHVLGWKS